MFVTDRPLRSKGNSDVKMVEFNSEKDHNSLISEESAQKIEMLEASMCRDPGLRGIQHLIMPGHLLKATAALSHASSVLITTGYFDFYFLSLVIISRL